MPYYVYILLCEDGSYYTGYTKDIANRVAQHVNGSGARYTKMHKPKEVVFTEEFDSRGQAMKREKAIKKLSHQQKANLIGKQKPPRST